MFGLSRRSVLARSKSLTTLPARAPVAAQPSCINIRDFHSTPSQAESRHTWMPMRVKTPWIDALTQSREAEKAGPQVKAGQSVKRDISPKKMSDSYYSAILPLAQDKWLLDSYLNASGHIRLGSLLMDLDALAGIIAYRHTGDGVSTVTAACDRITIENPLMEICDLELSGQCTYATGRSSMEISLQVTKARPEGQKAKPEDVLITCAFTMVSLDPTTKTPVPVAPLIVETEEEKRLFQKGEANYKAKKALRTRSLLEKSPDDEESNLIHSMWTKEMSYLNPQNAVTRPANQAFMSDTVLKSAMIMQPQYRNRHNFMIFGGFLLKQTFELAFCCAASFAHARPNFVALDPSTFENPVPVGSVLYLRATVSYTEPEEREGDNTKYTKVQVRVDSKVRDVEHGTKKSTGMFNYTFLVENDVQIMPKGYGEFMLWADARRRAQNAAAIDPAHKTSALRSIKDSVTE
ncbi:Acyl-CoA thioester hydrolase, putative [Penicillium digitatum]|uniref:Acyl-CoA thioester hydrolase, putative n=3 Tax=Penicillium digitatum TaxID=36651 RepID=K9GEU8_PEND2|nr:Acyl-CoA thioester hydrolase, putative [Penicillium digitatum Pd1]EKV19727.1 Acyl-CoA thioester hydrolase, putative [Penicillium digitatum PHI26]EKV20784.1 Acyl-CoA thioester hydrolase, putative [Penicillium digitatum Pd1]QQK44815.1 Acyl-CoA thioester hydrolase, putative [Penicillium digitatum]